MYSNPVLVELIIDTVACCTAGVVLRCAVPRHAVVALRQGIGGTIVLPPACVYYVWAACRRYEDGSVVTIP